jgi:hypothetical protein
MFAVGAWFFQRDRAASVRCLAGGRERQSGTPTHELQRLGGWRTSVMVERYAHLAPDHLAKAASRLDSVLAGYDLATLEKKKGSTKSANPL